MVLDPQRRAEAKRASRVKDQARLRSGEIDAAALSRENGMLSKDQLRGVRLVRSGKQVLAVPRLLMA